MAGSRIAARETVLPTSLSRSDFFVWGIERDKTRSQTRYFEAPPMTGATIYPGRDQLVVELAVGGGIAALVGFLLLDSAWEALFGNGLGDLGGVATTAAFVFVILIIFPAVHLLGLRGAVDAARELRHPLPLCASMTMASSVQQDASAGATWNGSAPPANTATPSCST